MTRDLLFFGSSFLYLLPFPFDELCCLVMEPLREGMKNSGGDSGLHGGIAEFNVFCFLNGFRCDGVYWIEPLRAGIGGGGPREATESDLVRLRLSLSCGGLIFGGSVGGGEAGMTGR